MPRPAKVALEGSLGVCRGQRRRANPRISFMRFLIRYGVFYHARVGIVSDFVHLVYAVDKSRGEFAKTDILVHAPVHELFGEFVG